MSRKLVPVEVSLRPYKPTPTAAKFHASRAFFRGLMGPIGSGKSVACVMELFSRALEQKPDQRGVRFTRFAVIRNTYPQLLTTSLKTWSEWIPETLCPVSKSPPVTGRLEAQLSDGTRLNMEIIFLSLDRPEDLGKLKSLELTGAWINEAAEIWPEEILTTVMSRVGRFPPKDWAPITWSGVIADTNPPTDDHWWYRLAEVERPEGFEFFRQPPALLRTPEGLWIPNPEAENVEHQPLGHEYWTRMVPGAKDSWLKVFCGAEYGVRESGRPVYPEYDDQRHCPPVDPTKPMFLRGRPLLIGMDFGLSPAAVYCQQTATGGVMVLAEDVAENMGVRRFMEELVLPRLNSQFHRAVARVVGDPAGVSRAQTDEVSCFDVVREYGLDIVPAETNAFIPRREAVSFFLRLHKGLVIHPDCKVLRRGFLGRYCYRRVRTAEQIVRYLDIPEKNEYSHVHDALQYACLELRRGSVEVTGGGLGMVGSAGGAQEVGARVARVAGSWV